MSTLAPATTRLNRLEIPAPAGILIAGLVAALYAPVLAQMAVQWWRDPDYGHGFVVPLISGYVLYKKRCRLWDIPREPRNLGFVVMLGAIALLLTGTLGAELFVARFSLLILLTGILVFLAGWTLLRAIAFPLTFLALMIPLPALVYNQITFPLQLLASRLSANCLQLLGIPVLREGNILVLPNYSLEVVEACSGIRSLMTLIALAVAYGYFAERRSWARIFLVLLMLPTAVASNAVRVVGVGVLTYVWGPHSAEGFFHIFQGWLMFVFAVACMLFVHWLISQIGPWKARSM